MNRQFDKPIVIQNIDPVSETWVDWKRFHARINARGDSENAEAGAIRIRRALTFEIRYVKSLEVIANNLQSYRIVYRGNNYDLEGYDDFYERHNTVKLVGVSY